MRIASVPASHVYVQHLSGAGGVDSVVRLSDPRPHDDRKIPGGWWPPLMLEPGWVSRNHERFDVFHVHFGFDAVGAEVLADVMQELKMHDKPLVYTVHDLRNPHHAEPDAHAEQQAVLVAAAHTLITLTPGAAEDIHARWGRDAVVLPHPHVLDSARIVQPRTRDEQFVIGVHAKSLRANMDPLALLDTLVDSIADLPDAVLQIDVHDEIFDPSNHWYAPDAGAALTNFDRHSRVRVRVHPYFSEEQLWAYLASLTVSVLPYRFGTHSGWLEACYDLGTAVIAPDCGYYHQQHPCEVFDFAEERFDESSLRSALARTYERWEAGATVSRATWTERRSERNIVAQNHLRLYEAALT
jgi:hypothetical protein